MPVGMLKKKGRRQEAEGRRKEFGGGSQTRHQIGATETKFSVGDEGPQLPISRFSWQWTKTLLPSAFCLQVESVPTLMYRLQKSCQSAATTVDDNVMSKGELDEPEVSHNVMVKSESDLKEPASFDRVTSSIASSAPNHQGALDPDRKLIEAGFTGLGLMTWSSNSRLGKIVDYSLKRDGNNS